MYISISEAEVVEDRQFDAQTEVDRVHDFLRTMPGFRWAMYLHSLDAPDRFAAVSMWLSPEQATAQDGAVLGSSTATRGYDVVTARGGMTPASHVAIVEWQVDAEIASGFSNRWNAAYHAIEDRIGSRLLKDLDTPGRHAALHAVTEESNLDARTLGAPVEVGEGVEVSPQSVHRYEVLLLKEA